MNVVQSTHQFADAATAQIQGLQRYAFSGATLHNSGLPKLFSSVTSTALLTMEFFISNDCQLIIRQGPENARVAVGKEKGTPTTSERRALADPLFRPQTCRPATHYPAQDQPSLGPRSKLFAKYESLPLAGGEPANLSPSFRSLFLHVM